MGSKAGKNSRRKKDSMNQLKNLKKGDFFTVRPIADPDETQVWIKGDYDRSSKTYSCIRFDDCCRERFLKPSTKVYTDFVF